MSHFAVDKRSPEEYHRDARGARRLSWAYKALFLPLIILFLASAVSVLWPWGEIRFTQFQPLNQTYNQGDVVVLEDHFCWGPGLNGKGQAFTNQREFISANADGSAGPVRYGVGDIGFDYYVEGAEKKYTKATDYCAPSSVRIQIPFVLPPGKWVVRYTVVYDPTPLPFDTQIRTNTSTAFTVAPSDTLKLGGDTTPAG